MPATLIAPARVTRRQAAKQLGLTLHAVAKLLADGVLVEIEVPTRASILQTSVDAAFKSLYGDLAVSASA